MTPPLRLAPAPLPDFDPSVVVDVDVREDLRAGHEPLARILAAAEALAPGAVLHLRTPFQPTPLFTVLARLGFQFHAEHFAADDHSSWFWRDEPVVRSQPVADADLATAGGWDLRMFPAPEPLRLLVKRMVKESSAFDVLLPACSELLLSIIREHGWRASVVATSGSSVRLRLTPATPAAP